MGYNFNCSDGCSLPNSHFGPCNALSKEEKLAQAVLTNIFFDEDDVAGLCRYCLRPLEGIHHYYDHPEQHAKACIVLAALGVMQRREELLRFAAQKGIT